MNTSKVIEITQKWLDKFVIGLNLCPFAKHPFKTNRVRYLVYEGQDMEALTEKLVEACFQLADESPSAMETTLVIVPNYLSAFDDYLDYVSMAEFMLTQLDLEGVIQIASFHPDYQFDGTEPTDAENYTNRSPFPILHLLRESSIERAIEAFPEVGDIPERNIETMNQLGVSKLKEMMHDVTGEN